MKILVTGANGFLGHYLTAQLVAKKYTVIATGLGACRLPFEGQENFFYETMDFTDDARVQAVFHKHKPDVVVHAGALCKPDDCELQQELAYKINVKALLYCWSRQINMGVHFFMSLPILFLMAKKGCMQKMIFPTR